MFIIHSKNVNIGPELRRINDALKKSPHYLKYYDRAIQVTARESEGLSAIYQEAKRDAVLRYYPFSVYLKGFAVRLLEFPNAPKLFIHFQNSFPHIKRVFNRIFNGNFNSASKAFRKIDPLIIHSDLLKIVQHFLNHMEGGFSDLEALLQGNSIFRRNVYESISRMVIKVPFFQNEPELISETFIQMGKLALFNLDNFEARGTRLRLVSLAFAYYAISYSIYSHDYFETSFFYSEITLIAQELGVRDVPGFCFKLDEFAYENYVGHLYRYHQVTEAEQESFVNLELHLEISRLFEEFEKEIYEYETNLSEFYLRNLEDLFEKIVLVLIEIHEQVIQGTYVKSAKSPVRFFYNPEIDIVYFLNLLRRLHQIAPDQVMEWVEESKNYEGSIFDHQVFDSHKLKRYLPENI